MAKPFFYSCLYCTLEHEVKLVEFDHVFKGDNDRMVYQTTGCLHVSKTSCPSLEIPAFKAWRLVVPKFRTTLKSQI